MSKPVKYKIIGVMSGTSLDGLDMALCEFANSGKKFDYKILKTKTVNYDINQRNKLKSAAGLCTEDYLLFHQQFGKYIAKEILKFLPNKKPAVDAIASHGHTVFHQPQKGFTSQIGCGASIAANSGITTICDFRSMDIALNGQGAPLVPVGDKLLFGEYHSCLNLGGISNISFDDKHGERIAFDIGPVNMALNYYALKAGFPYDKNGKIAASGQLNIPLLNQLNKLKYYSLKGAKSLGREWFEKEFLPITIRYDIPVKDVLHTIGHHAAWQIGKVLTENKLKNVLITGGGANNTFLMKCLRNYYKGKMTIPDQKMINFKEAIVFAFLGYLRLTEQINTLSSVTGAIKNSSGGAIYLAK
jgi:anhydro-N-acetylmuramic acid kinase